MSVSITQSPEGYTPASNRQVYVGLSNQLAQPNFAYTVVITDAITGESSTRQIPPDVNTNEVVFDGQPFVERFIEHYIPINLYGWQKATGIRNIQVNLGETYGATPTHHLGVTQSYKVWNAVLDYLEFPDYDPEDYKYDARTIQFNYLSSLLDVKTYYDRSDYLYALTTQVGDILKLRIETYDASGANIGTSDIDNPYQASTNYREKYLCIDIGHKGLSNIAASGVTGTYPILTSDVYRYEVYDISISITPNQSNLTLLKTITVGCEPRYDVYTIHYLRKNGAFEVLHFNKRSDTEIRTDRTKYSRIPYTLSNNQSTYLRSTPVDRILSSSTTTKIKLQTDYMTEEEIAIHQEILDSTDIYLDEGSLKGYPALMCAKDSYKINKSYNEKLYNIELDFEYAHQNHRQRG